MFGWTTAALAYGLYLAALAWLVPRVAPARRVSLAAAGALALLWWVWPGVASLPQQWAAVAWVVVPSLTLLACYRVSGRFFVGPSLPLERTLRRGDQWVLERSGVLAAYRAAGRAAQELVELLYLFVYLVVPLGAAVVVTSGLARAIADYWTLVFVAELTCYAALPWLQSRPPRALDAPVAPTLTSSMRRLNLLVLRHGSIQVNTVPSAHAAGAVAVAIAVSAASPGAGPAFVVLAAGITLATMLGRYHYALDSLLGVAVAIVSGCVLGAAR